MSVIIFVLVLLVVVLVHEFGHFSVAKYFKIRVDEFGFGFPPKMLTLFKKGDTEYTLNWLPIGGFVKIYGENPDEENTNGEDSKRSFVNKPKWQQALVLFAGVFMNFILAWLLFSIGFMSGLPTSAGQEREDYPLKNKSLVVLSVSPSSPAEISGLLSKDKIVSVRSIDESNNLNVLENINPVSFKEFIQSSENKEMEIGYIRGKNEVINIAKITPKLNENKNVVIGIAMDEIGIAKFPFFVSIAEGFKSTIYQTKMTAVGLFGLISDSFKGQADLSSVTGPVGITRMVGEAYRFSFIYLLSFTALISINLAIINLIPFPALDGGRLLFLLIEKIKGSRLNPKFANIANMIGFTLLILLMIFITYNDIKNLF